MADRPWRTSVGLVAVLLWSAVIGIPVLTLHLTSGGMFIVDHIHAAFLFVVSQILVYWMAARPHKHSPTIALKSRVLLPLAPIVEGNRVWEAELVPDKTDTMATTWTTDSVLEPADLAVSTSQRTVKLIVSNYLGSSYSRIVYVEPGGMQYKLLPGQELEIAATTLGLPATFQIVESDLATQIHAQGAGIAVSATLLQRSLVH